MKIYTVSLPDIGEGVVEGEVIQWLKQEGSSVAQDEPVVIVMTDKATVELPAPYPGILKKQHVQPGQIAIKDKPLYDLEIESETKQISEKKEEPLELQEEEVARIVKAEKKEQVAVQSTPPVRKLAREIGVDISKVSGTGKEGRITEKDLLQHVSQSDITSQEVPLIGIRRLMANKMQESHDKIPHFSYFEQVDATRLVQLRKNFKEKAEKNVHVTYMPFIIRALSLALQKFPKINSSFDEEKKSIKIHKQHNVGIAVSTSNGLIVPVLKNVQDLKIVDLIMAYDDLIKRAASNKLKNSEMKDSTISISNFGVLGGGGMWATPIINYPEAAILAIARIQKQAIVRNETLVARDILNLSWSFDHRIIDGDLAASFSHYFSTLLQNPASII